MVDCDDDFQPLIYNDVQLDRRFSLSLNCQVLNTDAEFEQVVYGYRKSRWRSILVYIFSTVTCGVPFLVFHWYPTWFLYATSVLSCFQLADQVLVVETYQKKCKTFFIHKILNKNVAETSGLYNEGFQDDIEREKGPVETAEDSLPPIHLEDGTVLLVQEYRYFRHKKQVLVWEGARAQWSRLCGVERGATCAQLHAALCPSGVSPVSPVSTRPLRASRTPRSHMLNVYGWNEMPVPVQSALTLVALELVDPFYVFQFFTIGVWLAEPYYYYCVAVVLMTTFGVATSVMQTKKNQESLRATVAAGGDETVRLSDGRRVSARALCPGDVLDLEGARGALLCDAVLLSGTALLNESMLTGESVPVTKTPLPVSEGPLHERTHAHCMLLAGTELLQTRRLDNQPARAVVVRTGYLTSKGQLVRSILYPAPADFQFDTDSYWFILLLAAVAALGLAYTVALKAYRGVSAGDVALKALDIITIVVPPALPAAMTVGRLHAVRRLQRARVSCLHSRAINVSGCVDCFCFDKTGTLTEEGLDMWGAVPLRAGALGPVQRHVAALPDTDHLKRGMAACHSLALLDGRLVGDPLDLKMFESTQWLLEEREGGEGTVVRPRNPATGHVGDAQSAVGMEVCIVQQYQFVSSLQRASVAVRVRGEGEGEGEAALRLYCKGAPETLAALCRAPLPRNLRAALSGYAAQGYRVIALATRALPPALTPATLQRAAREDVERELELLGLVVLENRLKPTSAAVVREMQQARIHVVMATGDNVETAVSVATECGILRGGARVVTLRADHSHTPPRLYCESTLHGERVGSMPLSLACLRGWGRGAERERGAEPDYSIVMTGDAWTLLLSEGEGEGEVGAALRGAVLARGAVFARMTADHKQRLVAEYQALGYYVGMCGDGANDCGALRAAHTGVSLSATSSVAATFAARGGELAGAARVVREGRAALVTSFGVFKFMVGYSLAEFLSVALLYYFDSNLTDFQFLYVDVALIVNFAFFFGRTQAWCGPLHPAPPPASLLAPPALVSLAGQVLLLGAAQYLAYYALTLFPWYERHLYEGDEANECWENYAIFTVSMFQYVVMAVVFSHGAPYRRSVITNKQLMCSIIIMTGICIYITLTPAQWLARFLELKMPPDSLMSYIVLALAAFHFVLALFFERIIVQYMIERKEMIPKWLKERKIRDTPHLTIKRQLTNTDYLDGETVLRYEKEAFSPAR